MVRPSHANITLYFPYQTESLTFHSAPKTRLGQSQLGTKFYLFSMWSITSKTFHQGLFFFLSKTIFPSKPILKLASERPLLAAQTIPLLKSITAASMKLRNSSSIVCFFQDQ